MQFYVIGTHKRGLSDIMMMADKLADKHELNTFIDAAVVYNNLDVVRQVTDKHPRIRIILKFATVNFKKDNIERVVAESLKTLGKKHTDRRIIPMLHSQFDTPEEDIAAYDKLQALLPGNRVSMSNFDDVRFRALCDSGRQPAYAEFECNPYAFPKKAISNCSIYEAIGYRTFGKAGALLKDPKICELAARMGWTPAYLLQWWSLEHGVTPIISTTNPANMDASIKAIEDRDLGRFKELKDALDALNEKKFTVMHEWCNVLETE